MNDFIELSLTAPAFRRAMLRADTFANLSPNDAAYWTGFRRGLRRLHHGERFGTHAEHEQWIALDGDRGRGYDDGLLVRWPDDPEPSINETEGHEIADAIMGNESYEYDGDETEIGPDEPAGGDVVEINQFRERSARYAAKRRQADPDGEG